MNQVEIALATLAGALLIALVLRAGIHVWFRRAAKVTGIEAVPRRPFARAIEEAQRTSSTRRSRRRYL